MQYSFMLGKETYQGTGNRKNYSQSPSVNAESESVFTRRGLHTVYTKWDFILNFTEYLIMLTDCSEF